MPSVIFRLMLSSASALLLAVSGTAQVQAAKVAIIDAGSNLPGVTGIDFVRGTENPFDETSNGHGTTITRIINAFKPVEDIIALKVVGSSFEFNPSISEAALAAAVEMPDVRVVDVSNRNPISLGALQAAADGGRVLVINAGNRAGARPDGIAEFAPLLNGNAIIVGAVDPDTTLAPYSNRAGDLAEYYVVAPGFTEFNETQGTSFAKPHVSGLAALLLWTFPNLSPSDAIKIIMETADDLGEPGIDAVYGHGLINVQRALDPAEGEMIVPGGGGGGGSSGAVVIGGLAVVGVAAAVLASKKERPPLETTLVLDKYKRAYTMDLSEMVKVRPSRGSLDSVLKSLNVLERTHAISQTPESSAFLRITEPSLENAAEYNPTSWLNDDPAFVPEPSLSYYQQSFDGSGFSFHVNGNLSHEFGALGLASSPEDQISFLSNPSFSLPYLGYSRRGIASQASRPLTDNSILRIGMSRVDDQTRFGLRSDAAVVELVHMRERFSVGASLGHLAEYGSMFGGSRSGIYSVDDAKTFAVGLSGSYRLAEDVRLIGSYSTGLSDVDGTKNSLLSDFSSLRSDSWAMGVMFDNVARGRDRIGFAVSQPLKITQGFVNLSVPYAIDANSAVLRNTERVDLGAGPRELALESFYRFWTGKRTRFTTYLMHQRNPSNLAGAGSANTLMGIFEFQF